MAAIDEREVEKRVCKTLWDAFHEFVDNRTCCKFTDDWLLEDLKRKLEEAMPYGPEEVH